jgi:hypothetical protein
MSDAPEVSPTDVLRWQVKVTSFYGFLYPLTPSSPPPILAELLAEIFTPSPWKKIILPSPNDIMLWICFGQ